MKEIFLIILLVLISFSSCKEANKTEDKLNNGTQINETLIYDSKIINVDTLTDVILSNPPSITIIDSLDFKDLNLFTLNINEDFQINLKEYYSGSYLALLEENFNADSIFKSILSVYPIRDDYMVKDHFSDLTDIFTIDNQRIIKYAYCGGGAADMSDIFILWVSKDSISDFFYLTDWIYYYKDLDLDKINDSIVKLTYTARDKFGHFHSDYHFEINTKTKKVERFNPSIQSYYCLSSTSSDKFIVYKTIKEAENRIANSDSIIIESGISIKYDSVYWDSKVFKISIPDVGTGYVNFNDSGLNIPVNNAG